MDIHEGAALNFVFLGKHSDYCGFNSQFNSIYEVIDVNGGINWGLHDYHNTVPLGAVGVSSQLTLERCCYLALKGSSNGLRAKKTLPIWLKPTALCSQLQ